MLEFTVQPSPTALRAAPSRAACLLLLCGFSFGALACAPECPVGSSQAAGRCVPDYVKLIDPATAAGSGVVIGQGAAAGRSGAAGSGAADAGPDAAAGRGAAGQPAAGSGGVHGGGVGGVGGGTGRSALCDVGALRCARSGEAVEVCSIQGDWVAKESCDAVCSDGVCSGSCSPGAKHCGSLQTPETCSAGGEWQRAASACEFVCSGAGECGGECRPGDKRCSGADTLTPQKCDELGRWVSSAPCPNLCSSGSCGGSCPKGLRECATPTTPQSCGPMATWEPEPACPFVCTGAGECTGECKPRSTGCTGQTPHRCDDSGHWVDAPACVQGACNPSTGACAGVCTPQQLSCGANQTRQLCGDSGQWVPQRRCPYLCTGAAVCSGECSPNSSSCSDDGKLVSCSAEATRGAAVDCVAAQVNEVGVCVTDHCESQCSASARKCPGAAHDYCWNLQYGCDQCLDGYVWRDARSGDHVCVLSAARTAAKQENDAAASNMTSDGSCLANLAPRNAFTGDNVCVTLERQQAAQRENADSDSHKRIVAGMP